MAVMRFKQFITEAGASAERQENGFIALIKQSVKENDGKPITVKSKDATIKNVVDAEKFTGRQAKGSEPYTDVQLILKSGKKVNLSMKGPSAPTLAGGGLRGIEEIIPNIGYNFYKAAFKNHKKNKLKDGDKVPDTYGKLNDTDKNVIVVGNAAIGGPIDFMYIGPMDVSGELKNGVLSVNGKLTDADKFADEHDLFFRLRARRNDQVFDMDAKYPNGTPKVYSKSPSRGDSAGRIMVTDKPASKRDQIEF
jgi:hypothetical protein